MQNGRLLSIETTHNPATDLGYLLRKNPANAHLKELSFGKAAVVFPIADEDRCQAALLLDVDSVGQARKDRSAHYVDDQPYTAGSFAAVALNRMFSTAMTGKSKDRPELARQPIPLTIKLAAVRCGEASRVDRYFSPLGWKVETVQLGEGSPVFTATLNGTHVLADALNMLAVLLPALDGRKHYFVADDEVEKIVRKAGVWLKEHPARQEILQRNLRRKRSLILQALDRLGVESVKPESKEPTKPRLHDERHDAVVEAIKKLDPASLIDLGCGSGKLPRRLLKETSIPRIAGMEIAWELIERLDRWVDGLSPSAQARVEIFHGSLVYRDRRIGDYDVAALVEVIEHLDPARLRALEDAVFADAQPRHVIVTTPNREYNAVYELGKALRHEDHRFEWTRQEFRDWCAELKERHGYSAEITEIGEPHPEHGGSSQMAVLSR